MRTNQNPIAKIKLSGDELADVRRNVLPQFLNEKKLILLSRTSYFFYREAKSPEYWRSKFLRRGLDPDLWDELIKSNTVTDYQHLYHAYKQYICLSPINPVLLRELQCLSGEIKALNAAWPEDGMKDGILMSQGMSEALLYAACLSGNFAAIIFAYEKSILIFPKEKDYFLIKMLLNIIKSGSIATLDAFLIKFNLTLDKITFSLSLAAQSGDVNMMKKIFSSTAPVDSTLPTLFLTVARTGKLHAINFFYDQFKKELLSECKKKSEYGIHLLIAAVNSGKISVFELVAKIYVELGFIADISPADKFQILKCAAHSNNVYLMDHIFRKYKNDLSTQLGVSAEVIVLEAARAGCFYALEYAMELVEQYKAPLKSAKQILANVITFNSVSTVLFLRKAFARLQVTFNTEKMDLTGKSERMKNAVTLPLDELFPAQKKLVLK